MSHRWTLPITKGHRPEMRGTGLTGTMGLGFVSCQCGWKAKGARFVDVKQIVEPYRRHIKRVTGNTPRWKDGQVNH